MGYTAPPTPGTNRAVGSGYAKLTPSLRPPPRFPTKGADRARAGGATAPAPGRPRRSEAKYLSGRMQPLAASNRRFSTGLTETRLTGHPLDARPRIGHCSPAPTAHALPEDRFWSHATYRELRAQPRAMGPRPGRA